MGGFFILKPSATASFKLLNMVRKDKSFEDFDGIGGILGNRKRIHLRVSGLRSGIIVKVQSLR